MNDKATSKPWGIQPIANAYRILGGESHRIVASVPARREADAKLIVTAVNAHDALVEACEAALYTLRSLYSESITIDVLRSALAKAQEI